VLQCRSCRFVFTDPMPTHDAKCEIERRAYQGELLPEISDYFQNCHRNFKEDAVIRGFREGLRWIAEMTPPPGRLLDLGPGTGIFLHLAKEQGFEPFGIDVCDASAEKAAAEFGIRVDVGDFEKFAYEPASFDAITMLDVLEHTVDPKAVLARARELLKPGGVLYVAVPNQRCLMTAILDRYIRLGGPGKAFFLERLYVSPHVYYFNPQTLVRMMRDAGFELAAVKGGNVYLGRYRLPWLMRLPMELVLHAGSLIGMSAKIHVLARRPA
jgi:2-polyprenyl-3-methyl-5-hydroxy-6-metoxy-1,4-benzoquinol methylase